MDLNSRAQAVAQRFEAKYLLTEVEAELVRDYLHCYTVPDRKDPEYTVTSLYLDSPANALYSSSANGEKNRFKLRVRGYDLDPDRPVFFEVKQRVGGVIRKYRSTVNRSAVGPLTAMTLPGEDALVCASSATERMNLLLFNELGQRFGVEPRVCVRYLREAHVSAFEEPVRVTFDRAISFAPAPKRPEELWTQPRSWSLLDGLPVVFEIKFTNAYPLWVRRLVQRFNLRRTSLAKYVASVDQMGLEHYDVSAKIATTHLTGTTLNGRTT